MRWEMGDEGEGECRVSGDTRVFVAGIQGGILTRCYSFFFFSSFAFCRRLVTMVVAIELHLTITA